MIVRGMRGLGDNIYQRAFVRNMQSSVWVDTPWPELYADLSHVQCIRPKTELRTQKRNVERTSYAWAQVPAGQREMRVAYGHAELARGSIVDAMRRIFRVAPQFDLPDFGPSLLEAGAKGRPVAIVRPVTVRSEWHNEARAPLPEYIAAAAAELLNRGYHVVSLADVADGQEWLVGDAPPADVVLHGGELSVTQLLAAVAQSAVVVGGVGWIVPACIAAGTPLYTILGGNLAHNAPDRITDAGTMDLSRAGWAWPDKPCVCAVKAHNCNKVISGFDEHFRAWLDGQGLFGVGVQRPGLAA
ncbi:hypothetical protein [Achromobacter pestifer]